MINLSTKHLYNRARDLDPDSYNLSKLSYLQKIILGTDGTVTQLIESIVGEPLKLEKLAESDLPKYIGQAAQRRIITLNGTLTGLPYLYADSLVYHHNMAADFSQALLETRMPIGKAWEKFQIETYKTLKHWGFERAATTAKHFVIEPDELLLYRTYFVYSQGKIIFEITEKFPCRWFIQAEQLNQQPELSTLVSGI